MSIPYECEARGLCGRVKESEIERACSVIRNSALPMSNQSFPEKGLDSSILIVKRLAATKRCGNPAVSSLKCVSGVSVQNCVISPPLKH